MSNIAVTVYKLRVNLEVAVAMGMDATSASDHVSRCDFQNELDSLLKGTNLELRVSRMNVEGVIPTVPAERDYWLSQSPAITPEEWAFDQERVPLVQQYVNQGTLPYFNIRANLIISVAGDQTVVDSMLRTYQDNFRMAQPLTVLGAHYLVEARPSVKTVTKDSHTALAVLNSTASVAPEYRTVNLNDIDQVKSFIVEAIGHLTGIQMSVVSPEGVGALVGLLMLPPPVPGQHIPSDYFAVEMYSMNQFIPEYLTFATPYLPPKLAEDLFQYLVQSNEYGGLVLRQRSGMISRVKVAEEGGYLLLVHRKSWKVPARYSWIPSKKQAMIDANLMLRQDLKDDIIRIEIVDFTNRKLGKQHVTEVFK